MLCKKNILLNILKYPYIYTVSLIDTLPEISIVGKTSLQTDTGQTLTAATPEA